MNTIVVQRLVGFAAAALALAASGAGWAQGLRIEVGDLSTPTAVHAFDHQVSDGARRFCRDRYRPGELSAIAACEKAVRDEALASLSESQMQAYAEGMGPQARLAAGKLNSGS